jgi:hypothetical protein
MRRWIGTGLIRLADLLETQWSFPRLGGVLVGIGLGLLIALALEYKWSIVSHHHILLLPLSMLCYIIGSVLMSRKRRTTREQPSQALHRD